MNKYIDLTLENYIHEEFEDINFNPYILAYVTRCILIYAPVKDEYASFEKMHAYKIDKLLERVDYEIGLDRFDHHRTCYIMDSAPNKGALIDPCHNPLELTKDQVNSKSHRKAGRLFNRLYQAEKRAKKRRIKINKDEQKRLYSLELPSVLNIIAAFSILFMLCCYVYGNIFFEKLGLSAASFFDIGDYVSCFGWEILGSVFVSVGIFTLSSGASIVTNLPNKIKTPWTELLREKKPFDSFLLPVSIFCFGVALVVSSNKFGDHRFTSGVTIILLTVSLSLANVVSAYFKNGLQLYGLVSALVFSLSLSYINAISAAARLIDERASYQGTMYDAEKINRKHVITSSKFNLLYDPTTNLFTIKPRTTSNFALPLEYSTERFNEIECYKNFKKFVMNKKVNITPN